MKKRVLALLICACMLIGMVPVFATEMTDEPTTETTNTVENEPTTGEQAPDASEPETEGLAQLPVEPEEPTEPEVPVEPTEPAEPAEPEAPVEPTEPAEPETPVEPTEPAEPEPPVIDPPAKEEPGAGDPIVPDEKPEHPIVIPPVDPVIPIPPVELPTCPECGAPEGADHLEDCSKYVPEEGGMLEDIVGDTKVTVSGDGLPSGVNLKLEGATLEEINAILRGEKDEGAIPPPANGGWDLPWGEEPGAGDGIMEEPAEAAPYFDFGNQPYVALDVSLERDGVEVQPDGKVTVTVNDESLGLEPGDEFIVYHIHEGVVDTIAPNQSENGEASFTLESFSTLIIVNSNANIDKEIKNYYAAAEDSTGNGNVAPLGVYVDQDDHVHLLLVNGPTGNGKSQTLKGVRLTLDKNYDKVGSLTPEYESVTQIKVDNNMIYSGETTFLFDFDFGVVPITQTFYITTNFNYESLDDVDKSNGWNLLGAKVELIIEYGIEKTVLSVAEETFNPTLESADAVQGNEVVYQITVENTGDAGNSNVLPITGASVTDTLPRDLFASGYPSTIEVKYPDETAYQSVAVSADGTFTIEDGTLNLNPGESKTYLVKAKIRTDAARDSYDNTAEISGGNATIPKDDTATIVITQEPVADLTIYKEGAKAIDENQSFVFHVTGPDDIALDVTIQVGADGKGSVTIKDLPAGDYNVKEDTSWSWRYNPQKNPQTVTLPGGEDRSVTFINDRTKDNSTTSDDWKWLNGNSYAVNRWDANGDVTAVKHSGKRNAKRKEG